MYDLCELRITNGHSMVVTFAEFLYQCGTDLLSIQALSFGIVNQSAVSAGRTCLHNESVLKKRQKSMAVSSVCIILKVTVSH